MVCYNSFHGMPNILSTPQVIHISAFKALHNVDITQSQVLSKATVEHKCDVTSGRRYPWGTEIMEDIICKWETWGLPM